MNNNYVVGLDFGTLSGRAVVVRANDGAEMGAAVHEYPHGVMDRTLSAADGRKLPPDFALQDPGGRSPAEVYGRRQRSRCGP